jgi:hypothetical protein
MGLISFQMANILDNYGKNLKFGHHDIYLCRNHIITVYMEQTAASDVIPVIDSNNKPKSKIDYTQRIVKWSVPSKDVTSGTRFDLPDDALHQGFCFTDDIEKDGDDALAYCVTYLGQKFGRCSVRNLIGAVASLWFYNIDMSKPDRDHGGYRKAFVAELTPILSDLIKVVYHHRDVFMEGDDNETPFLIQPSKPIRSVTTGDQHSGRFQYSRSIDPRKEDFPAVVAYWSSLEDAVRFILVNKLGMKDVTARYGDGDRSDDFDLSQVRPIGIDPEIAQKWAKVALMLYDVAWECLNTKRGYIQIRAKDNMISQTQHRFRTYRAGASLSQSANWSQSRGRSGRMWSQPRNQSDAPKRVHSEKNSQHQHVV